jgi:hypothetical protein
VAGFIHYRPIASVDATFLTGKYKGTLMVVVGMTAKNQLPPLAFALVEGENNESWSWFLWLVKKYVLGPNRSICMILDHRRGGYPPLIHRWCSRHFAAVEVVLRHFHRCRYRSSPLWFFCWRGTDRSGSWLSGNTVDMKIYVVRAAGA